LAADRNNSRRQNAECVIYSKYIQKRLFTNVMADNDQPWRIYGSLSAGASPFNAPYHPGIRDLTEK
jgi:hypothetical protein